jgi:hypothetical protein
MLTALFMTYRSTKKASSTSSDPSGRLLDSRTLAGHRLCKYLAEPSTLGNTLVGLSRGTPKITVAEAAHKQRIAEELAKLNAKLP